MVLGFKRLLVVSMFAMFASIGCLEAPMVPLQLEDVQLEESDTTYRKNYCNDLKENVLNSSLINLNGIEWTKFKSTTTAIYAWSSNPNTPDYLSIVVPRIFPNSALEYRATIWCKANIGNQEKLDIKTIAWVLIDNRSETIDVKLCNHSTYFYVASDRYNVDISARLRFAK